MARGIRKSKTALLLKGGSPRHLDKKRGFSLFSYGMETFILLSEQMTDPDKKEGLAEHIAAGVVTMLILVQIRIGLSNMSSQQVDQLPSVRLYKSRVLGDYMGRVMGASVATIDCTEFVSEVEPVIEELTSFPIPICKPVAKPTQQNYPQYIYYRMSQVMGFIQSTPTTNLNLLNLKPDCANWNLEQALAYIDPNNLAKLNKENVGKIILDNR